MNDEEFIKKLYEDDKPSNPAMLLIALIILCFGFVIMIAIKYGGLFG